MSEAMIKCMGCGGLFADIEGPTHRYIQSSPGCWATYGEVLAWEYSDQAYFQVHRLTVDAYAVQHPGHPSAQSIQSVAVHLISLCLALVHNVDLQRATAAIQMAVKIKGRFVWLTPPSSLGSFTIADVHKAQDVEEHMHLVRTWADSVWSAWSPHHATIHAWLPKGN